MTYVFDDQCSCGKISPDDTKSFDRHCTTCHRLIRVPAYMTMSNVKQLLGCDVCPGHGVLYSPNQMYFTAGIRHWYSGRLARCWHSVDSQTSSRARRGRRTGRVTFSTRGWEGSSAFPWENICGDSPPESVRFGKQFVRAFPKKPMISLVSTA